MNLQELLSHDRLKELKVINAACDLTRIVTTIESTETPDVISYVTPNCFIITTAMIYKGHQENLCKLIKDLSKLPCAGLGIKLGRFIDELEPEVLKTADEENFPLISIPRHMTLGEVYHELLMLLWNAENQDLVDALNIQKKFCQLIMQDASMQQLLKSLNNTLSKACLVADCFGRIIERCATTPEEENDAARIIEDIKAYEKDNLLPNRQPLPVEIKGVTAYAIRSRHNSFYYLLTFDRGGGKNSAYVVEELLLMLSLYINKRTFIQHERIQRRNQFFDLLLSMEEETKAVDMQILNAGKEYGLEKGGSYKLMIGRFAHINSAHSCRTGALTEFDEIYTLLFDVIKDALYETYHDRVLLFPVSDKGLFVLLMQDYIPDIHEFLWSVSDNAGAALGDVLWFVEGKSLKNLYSIRDSYWKLLEYMDKTTFTNDRRINVYDSSDILELIRSLPSDQIEHVCRTTLKDLTIQDEASAVLRETLKVFLGAWCSTAETAERMHMHRNTVRYRIRKCEEILGHSIPGDPDFILRLQICLELFDEKPIDT